MQERAAILQLHAGSLPLAADVALPDLATACHGYSGADLAALCREAAMAALSDAAAAILEGTKLVDWFLAVNIGHHSYCGRTDTHQQAQSPTVTHKDA